jgi:hypothetical protein
VLRWLAALQEVFAENQQQLTALDSAVGDGDLGISLDRGFTAVQAELSANPPADLRAVFQTVATVLIRTMGGTSGPLLGTFFLRAGAACAGKSELAPADVVALFHAGVDGIQQRGKAALGDCFPQWMRCGLPWRLETVRRKSWNGARRRPKQACRRPFPCPRARAVLAIWENAAWDTRTPARSPLT